MRNVRSIFMLVCLAMFVTFSCQQEENFSLDESISEEAMHLITEMGFSTQNVQKIQGGYLVEGDIIVSEQSLREHHDHEFLRVGEEEQYRTNNIVSGTRTIRVGVSSTLPSSYVSATDVALARYNALPLRITFVRVSSSPNITITRGTGNYLAAAGFPSGGNPYPQILMNTTAIGNQPQNTVATIIAHEIGHCIGFRLTDYMNRSYSCGGQAVNEGASNVGAVHIPGTPTGPDPNSWMLACIGSGQNRPFNANDRRALEYLY